MRPLEILLALVTLVLAARPWLARGAGLSLLLTALLLAALGAQFLLEGWRRPLLPLCLMALANLLLIWLPLPQWRANQTVLLAGLELGGLLLALLVAGVAKPAWQLPPPTGPLAVGMTTLALDDAGVDGATIDAEHAPPQVRLWYPAVAPAGPKPDWRARLRQPPRPSIASAAAEDAEPLPGQPAWPLILYQPGWPGTRVENLKLVRDLVSHGYVVATLEYPRRLPGMTAERHALLVTALEAPPPQDSEAEFRAGVQISIGRMLKRAQDSSRVVDAVFAQRSVGVAGKVEARIDRARIAALGFSLGGAIAVQTRRIDPRIRAVVNIDGRHWAGGRREGIPPPYLMLSEPLPLPTEADLNSSNLNWRYNCIEDYDDYTMLEHNLRRHGGLHVVVDGAAHENFTDAGLSSKLHRYSGGGRINGRRALEITSNYLLAFFGQALRGEASPLLERNPPQYPEVQVSVYPGGGRSPASRASN